MKKWSLVILLAVALFAFAACGKDTSRPQPAGASQSAPAEEPGDGDPGDSSQEDEEDSSLAGQLGGIGGLPAGTGENAVSGAASGGTYSAVTLVAPPDNTVHSETVVIEATGDVVTHLQITTGSDVDNPNNDFALQSYQHWLPILRDYYSAQAGCEFSADEAAGTWTIDADINDDTIDGLAEYYVDFSPYKNDGYLSQTRLVQYYTEVLRYTEAGA